jgi:hypothetical protein
VIASRLDTPRQIVSNYERSASPFNWTFTRRDLHALLAKIAVKRLAAAA